MNSGDRVKEEDDEEISYKPHLPQSIVAVCVFN